MGGEKRALAPVELAGAMLRGDVLASLLEEALAAPEKSADKPADKSEARPPDASAHATDAAAPPVGGTRDAPTHGSNATDGNTPVR